MCGVAIAAAACTSSTPTVAPSPTPSAVAMSRPAQAEIRLQVKLAFPHYAGPSFVHYDGRWDTPGSAWGKDHYRSTALTQPDARA